MKHQDDEPLPGAADVSKSYGALPGAKAPAELDARILARAREAASESNKVVAFKRRAIRRWATPVAAAASVVVVMSVVYETQFSSPRDSSAVVATAIEQDAAASPQDDMPAPASPAPEAAAERPAAARANAIQPPPPMVAPVVGPPAVSLSESIAPASPAPVISVPLPSAASSEGATVGNELRQEKKQQENTAQETQELDTRETVHAKASAMAAQGQLLGMTAKRADAKASLAVLEPLAGQYNYESYRLIMLSGQVLGLKELGATSATLDVNAQGTLTLRMKLTNGTTSTRTAQILDAKLEGDRGYWLVQWPDLNYPVQMDIALEGGKLVSRTQFEEVADAHRFGNVEHATLKRVVSK